MEVTFLEAMILEVVALDVLMSPSHNSYKNHIWLECKLKILNVFVNHSGSSYNIRNNVINEYVRDRRILTTKSADHFQT